MYRLARLLRVVSTIVLVLVLVYLGTAIYSAYGTARSGVGDSSFTTAFEPNDTLALMGQFSLDNGGIYPINGFTLHVVVHNGSGKFIGESTAGPESFLPGVNQSFPFTFYLPVSGSGPAISLLTQDQPLRVGLWANATFAYLFPVSVSVTNNRSWGAPFADFSVSVGTPFAMGSTVEVPVTVQFQNHASFSDEGALAVTVFSSSEQDCGGGSFDLDVPAGSPYSQTSNFALVSGCDPSGGTAESTYTPVGGAPVTLPTEAIP